jgi:glycosyltransferase involved in cell wall biosynthesis
VKYFFLKPFFGDFPMPKIVLLGDIEETGGTGTYFRRIIDFLSAKYDLQVVLLTGQASPSLVAYLDGEICKYSRFDIPMEKIARYLWKIARRLGLELLYMSFRERILFRKIQRRYHPDLVFISQGGGIRYFEALRMDIPVLIVCHSLFSGPISNETCAYTVLRRFNSIDRTNRALIHVSPSADAIYKKNIHNASLAAITQVIPNHGSLFPVIRKESSMIRVLTLGHVVGYKNPAIWLEVAKAVDLKFPGATTWKWAGSGPELKSCIQAAKGYSNIEFIGYQSDVAALYSTCDIYFQPSLYESQCISVLDAMKAGVPSIVSNAGGLPDSIRDGLDGLVCETKSVEAYVHAFACLIESPEKRKEMGENSKDRYQELFSAEKWAHSMDGLLSRVFNHALSRQR